MDVTFKAVEKLEMCFYYMKWPTNTHLTLFTLIFKT